MSPTGVLDVKQSGLPSWFSSKIRKTWIAVFIISQLAFAVYIYALYGTAVTSGRQEVWGFVFDNIHKPAGAFAANLGITLHLFLAAFIMIIGPLQFVPLIREKTPRVHHWTGRIFLAFAALTSLGGLTFIFTRGTVGGLVMDVGFGSYGILLLVCIVQAWRNAVARNIATHQRWAIRVFLMCTCSWMWRIDYTAWAFANNCKNYGEACAGHTSNFQGIFDDFMAFAFYIVPMALLEMYFYFERTKKYRQNPIVSDMAVLITLPILIVGAIGIFVAWWLPGIECAFGPSLSCKLGVLN